MTGTVFYWSDLHLGHNKVAELRGFSTTEDHDAAIIDAWNTTVTPRDTVWVLGDLTAGGSRDTRNALQTIGKLPGTKRLITGNHDRLHPNNRPRASDYIEWLETFTTIDSAARIKLHGTSVLLNHFPYSSKTSPIKPGPTWRVTPYEGYYVNKAGQVRGKYGRVLKPWLAGSGYEYVTVCAGSCAKNVTVHSLVCSAFHGVRPSGMQVAHNDGNKLNNDASNLRWASPTENAEDKKLHGTATGEAFSRPGEENGRAKLTAMDAEFIRCSDESGASLAKQFGVSKSTVFDIKKGRTWANEALDTAGLTGDHTSEERYTQWRLPNLGAPLIHGHVHAEWRTRDRMLNVGVDHWPTPVPQNVVLDWLDNISCEVVA